jgi:hypothetical protein
MDRPGFGLGFGGGKGSVFAIYFSGGIRPTMRPVAES